MAVATKAQFGYINQMVIQLRRHWYIKEELKSLVAKADNNTLTFNEAMDLIPKLKKEIRHASENGAKYIKVS